MSTAIAGTVEATADPQNGAELSPTAGLGIGCVDSTGTYAYYGTRSFAPGGVVRLRLSDMTLSWLYAASFFAAGDVYCVFLSSDGLTLYTVSATGVQSALVSGASGSPTLVSSETAIYNAFYLSDAGRYYVLSTQKAIEYLDLGSGSVVNEFRWPGNLFIGAVGKCRYASNSILVGSSASNPGYVSRYNRATGHADVICGNGETNTLGSSGTAVYAYASKAATSIDSDGDGRVYMIDGGSFRMVDSGTVTAPGTLTATSLLYVPQSNKAILQTLTSLRRVA